MFRVLLDVVGSLLRAKVLHADRPGDAPVDRLEDILAGGLPEDRAENVEVPVVVVPEGAGSMTVARRSGVTHGVDLARGGNVHTRACLEEIEHASLPLPGSE